METKNFAATAGHGFLEYQLVANTDAAVRQKVIEERKFFDREYRKKTAIQANSYIKLAVFLARDGMEETLTRWMQRICNKHQSFTVSLNNYSGFPPDTIYLRVQNAMPFQQLAKELQVIDRYIHDCSCPPMQFVSQPHVSIASKLPEEIFCKALTQYAHKTFHETFLVSELLLIKKEHPDDVYKPVNVFAFRP